MKKTGCIFLGVFLIIVSFFIAAHIYDSVHNEVITISSKYSNMPNKKITPNEPYVFYTQILLLGVLDILFLIIGCISIKRNLEKQC